MKDVIKIGLLEDDDVVAHMLAMAFEQAGWSCDLFTTLAALRQAVETQSYEVLVLDWSVPDGTADSLIPWLRERIGWETPILVESVLGDEARIVAALGLGADDYVVKPLRLAEVRARILALLRRAQSDASGTFEGGPYRIDTLRRELTRHGEPIELTRVEFDLALYFFRHAGALLSRARLLADVWGISASLDTRTVDTHVSRLRKKLRMEAAQGVRISSLHGYGYRLETAEDASDQDASDQ